MKELSTSEDQKTKEDATTPPETQLQQGMPKEYYRDKVNSLREKIDKEESRIIGTYAVDSSDFMVLDQMITKLEAIRSDIINHEPKETAEFAFSGGYLQVVSDYYRTNLEKKRIMAMMPLSGPDYTDFSASWDCTTKKDEGKLSKIQEEDVEYWCKVTKLERYSHSHADCDPSLDCKGKRFELSPLVQSRGILVWIKALNERTNQHKARSIQPATHLHKCTDLLVDLIEVVNQNTDHYYSDSMFPASLNGRLTELAKVILRNRIADLSEPSIKEVNSIISGAKEGMTLHPKWDREEYIKSIVSGDDELRSTYRLPEHEEALWALGGWEYEGREFGGCPREDEIFILDRFPARYVASMKSTTHMRKDYEAELEWDTLGKMKKRLKKLKKLKKQNDPNHVSMDDRMDDQVDKLQALINERSLIKGQISELKLQKYEEINVNLSEQEPVTHQEFTKQSESRLWGFLSHLGFIERSICNLNFTQNVKYRSEKEREEIKREIVSIEYFLEGYNPRYPNHGPSKKSRLNIIKTGTITADQGVKKPPMMHGLEFNLGKLGSLPEDQIEAFLDSLGVVELRELLDKEGEGIGGLGIISQHSGST